MKFLLLYQESLFGLLQLLLRVLESFENVGVIKLVGNITRYDDISECAPKIVVEFLIGFKRRICQNDFLLRFANASLLLLELLD